MIPNWVGVIFLIYCITTSLYGLFPLSGIIIWAMNEATGSKLHPNTEESIIKAILSFFGMVLLGIVGYVAVMLIYNIPFSQWI